MKYRLKKETKPTLPTYGKYKAVAVHSQTVSSDEILKEAAQNSPLDEGVLIAALIRLSEVVNRHLRAGDRVRLQDWGLMKLEIESDKVDNLKDFRAKKHIRGVRLHFLPESYNGTQALYEGITSRKTNSPHLTNNIVGGTERALQMIPSFERCGNRLNKL